MKKGQCFDKNHGLTPLQNVDFFDSFRTLLFRSKKHYFLSRRSKNVSFWLCLLQKKTYRVFDKNHGLIFLEKCRFFSNLLDVQFCGLTSIFFLSRISKNVSFWLFLLKKNIWEKGRFFDKKHGLTPLQNVDFFYFART